MEARLDGGYIGVTGDLFASALYPTSLLVALGLMTALAVTEAVILLLHRGQDTRLESPPVALLDEFRLLLVQQQDGAVQTLNRLREAADKFERIIQELHHLLSFQSSDWRSQSDEIFGELRRFKADIEKMLPRETLTTLSANASVRTQPDELLKTGVDAVVAEVSAELLSMLEKDGRSSPVARLNGLRAWLAERAPQLDAAPLLNSEDLWLAVVLSTRGSNVGTVLPTLDTVIGAGPITDWFKCEAYDGTAPLHQADILKVANATIDSQTGDWRVTQPGSIRRQLRREST
jgi:hypothetical protein